MNNNNIFFLIAVLILGIGMTSCNPKQPGQKDMVKSYVDLNPIVVNNSKEVRKVCANSADYTPSIENPEHTPIRYVRVNFHIINSKDKSINLPPEIGTPFVKMLVDSANLFLSRNQKMYLPNPNNIPPHPTQLRYVLEGDGPGDDGIYYHYDDDYCYINSDKNATDATHSIFSKKQYEKYGVRKTEVLNVFLMEHHPDSLANRPRYKKINGVGFKTWAKVADVKSKYDLFVKAKRDDPSQWGPKERAASFFGRFLNHEIGHSLGLLHTWSGNDGCDDTPKNNNCWTLNAKDKGCDSWLEISNNVMDYNAVMLAYSACQLGKIHYNFAKDKSTQRKLLRPDWCTYFPKKTITVKRNTAWSHAKDLLGDLIVEDGATLTIECVVSLPKGAKVIVKPKGKLILGGKGHLTNRCGDSWQGIETWSKNQKTGEVVFQTGASVSNVSTSNAPPSTNKPEIRTSDKETPGLKSKVQSKPKTKPAVKPSAPSSPTKPKVKVKGN